MNQLERLPAELHALVAQHLDPADALSARLTSRVLSVLAALAIRRLRSTNADLPAEAWSVFPYAIGLVLKLEGRRDLAPLLSTLPGRLEDIEILVGRWSDGAGASYNSFLEQLLAHPCAPRLKRLVEQRIGVLPEVAEALLAGLPSLERCSLTLSSSTLRGSMKFTRFPAHLQQLYLCSSECRLDVAGLATCSSLTSLELRLFRNYPDNLPNVIAACQQLRSLSLEVDFSPQQQEDLLAAASANLAQLRSLHLPYAIPSPQQWQQLAQGLPSLQELQLRELHLAPGSPAAPGVTSLSAHTWLEENEGGAEGSGSSLAAVLPALQAFDTEYCNCIVHLTELTQVLWGHTQLAELKVWSMGIIAQAPWPPQELLSSLPQLRRLVLLDPPCASLDALLADAAGCAGLEELEVQISTGYCEYDGEPEPLTGAGLAALAAGACSGSLRRVVLETQLSEHMCLMMDEELDQLPEWLECFSLASVAVLLRPGALPRLRELELDVALPPLGHSKQQLEGAEAYIVRRVEAELGVRPAEGFAVVREPHPSYNACLGLPAGLSLRGAVGECVATLNVCLSPADWALLGLSPASAGL
jgi:hypothetical protein